MRIELLGPQHDRETFACGEPALDDYLRRQASQDLRRGVARVFVAVAQPGGGLVGYYTLSAASFDRNDLPAEAAKRLPRYPVPAAILGRLAVARERHGQGVGKVLLVDALSRTLEASRAMGVFAMIVDAKNDAAAAFYERFGFIPFASTRRRLFLPMATFAAMR